MFGWSMSARACRSASNRAITCRVSMPGLDDLEGHLALDRLALLGHVHHPETALADLLQQLVSPDPHPGRLRHHIRRRFHLDRRCHWPARVRVF